MRTTTFWFPKTGQRTWQDSPNEEQRPSPSAADRYDALFPGREDLALKSKDPQESGYSPASESPFRPTKPAYGATINGVQFSAADVYALLIEIQRKNPAGE